VVQGATFVLVDVDGFSAELKNIVDDSDLKIILDLLQKPFTPGKVVFFLEKNKIKLRCSIDEFLNIVFSFSGGNPKADHAEGFWTDHWHYNLDLLESYLEIYPEKLKEIVFDKKAFTFYDNDAIVRPRAEKYILFDGKPKQLHSVVRDEEKKKIIAKRAYQPHTLRKEYGRGEIYTTTLINKLFCILVNKLASLDPFGVGIEMEADKPNWFDALNGLPALFGSSSCETFELKRLINFIKGAMESTKIKNIFLIEEIHDFLINLSVLLNEHFAGSSADKDFIFWDKAYTLKEDYRQKTKFGFGGQDKEISRQEVLAILDLALKKLEIGIEKAKSSKEGLFYAYFINEVKEYSLINETNVVPGRFEQKKVPFFLEGQMHALRLAKNPDEARRIYNATRSSQLYDKKLKMYKVTSSLKDMPEEIGRCHAFTPGWLENESIWLHMEYKYLLEILEHGLYEEFYADFKNVLIPFQKPEVYGRSILENSSFIVSSAFPYKELQGNGFVARLSGSTVEFLQMWLHMNLGRKPFFINEKNELNLRFAPKLVGWLFAPKEKTYSFKLLGKMQVIYHNPKRKNTFGKNGVVIKKIAFEDKDGKPIEIYSDTIASPYALQIRSCQIKSIDIYLN
jgi:hypothetical protein